MTVYECQNTGKKAHPTEESAHEHRDRLAHLEPVPALAARRIKVYPCGDHWHVGRSHRRRRRSTTQSTAHQQQEA
jgi:hypothetical protein